MEHPLDKDAIAQEVIDKAHIMEAVSSTDAGINFLAWLCRLTKFNKPVNSLEDAARRDVWLHIRKFIPVSKLSVIEHQEVREFQESTEAMIRSFMNEGALVQEIDNG